jgi:hypothetical protein
MRKLMLLVLLFLVGCNICEKVFTHEIIYLDTRAIKLGPEHSAGVIVVPYGIVPPKMPPMPTPPPPEPLNRMWVDIPGVMRA